MGFRCIPLSYDWCFTFPDYLFGGMLKNTLVGIDISQDKGILVKQAIPPGLVEIEEVIM